MAIAFDASAESHTGTAGSANEASFTWNHVPAGTPAGILVFVINLDSSTPDATSVTYNGIDLAKINGASAADTAVEVGLCSTWFLGAGVPTGTQAVVVNRNNNAHTMYAVSISVTAAAGKNTSIHVPGIVLLQEDGTLAEQSVSDGGQAVNSLRVAGGMSGLATPPGVGANSTALQSIDIGNQGAAVCRETTAGTGSRSVGFSSATSDDRAFVHLAIIEVTPIAEIAMAQVGGY